MKKNKGFTLIEVSISLLLSAIILQALLGFYMQLYKDRLIFNAQVQLRNEAHNIKSYLSLYIRQAEKIEIVTTKGHKIKPQMEEQSEIIKEPLAQIKVCRDIQNDKKDIIIALEPNADPKYNSQDLQEDFGKKKLYYYGSANIISTQIEEIMISYDDETKAVTFYCILNKRDETNPRLIYPIMFTESIAYKKAYL